MNWKQYFDLKDTQKKTFKALFWILIIIFAWNVKNYVVKGPDFYCSQIKAVCELAANQTVPKPELQDYLWLDCPCMPSSSVNGLWKYRLTHTPLSLVTAIVLAYIISMSIYFLNYFKLQPPKVEKAEKKG